MNYTKEQKKDYFKNLRKRWNEAKKLSENEKTEIEAIIKNHGLNISITGYFFTKSQMNALKLDGIPYIDTKTFKGWKENGFVVKKGEKSKIEGITWAHKDKNDEEEFIFPKIYKLFHRSQVKPIN